MIVLKNRFAAIVNISDYELKNLSEKQIVFNVSAISSTFWQNPLYMGIVVICVGVVVVCLNVMLKSMLIWSFCDAYEGLKWNTWKTPIPQWVE